MGRNDPDGLSAGQSGGGSSYGGDDDEVRRGGGEFSEGRSGGDYTDDSDGDSYVDGPDDEDDDEEGSYDDEEEGGGAGRGKLVRQNSSFARLSADSWLTVVSEYEQDGPNENLLFSQVEEEPKHAAGDGTSDARAAGGTAAG
eukprot:contig_18414_g4518